MQFLVARGVPVCAHLGLTPQTVHALGGYHVQGKNLGKLTRFVRNFMHDVGSVRGAIEAYVASMKNKTFPDDAVHAW